MKKFIVFTAVSLLALTTASLWITKDATLMQNPGTLSPSAGAAAIGGAFELTDQHGNTVKDSDFRGRLILVFFGFTHCPDICPVTVKTLSDTMAMLGDKADQVAPVFISVDPGRDTPPVLKEFLAHFDTRIVGLTGSEEQIQAVAGAYKAYFSRKDAEASGDGEPAGHEQEHDEHAEHGQADYSVDHSGYVYVMDRDGNYVQHFQYDAKPEALADALKPLLK